MIIKYIGFLLLVLAACGPPPGVKKDISRPVIPYDYEHLPARTSRPKTEAGKAAVVFMYDDVIINGITAENKYFNATTIENKKKVETSVAAVRDSVVRCLYHHMTTMDHDVSGKMIIEFYIDTLGKVSRVKLKASAFKEDRFNQCVLGCIGTVDFSPIELEVPYLRVRLPISFSTGSFSGF